MRLRAVVKKLVTLSWQVFRLTCVLRQGTTFVGSDGVSRREVIEMDDRRPSHSQQGPGRLPTPPTMSSPAVVSPKSQLIVHCDALTASHNTTFLTVKTSNYELLSFFFIIFFFSGKHHYECV